MVAVGSGTNPSPPRRITRAQRPAADSPAAQLPEPRPLVFPALLVQGLIQDPRRFGRLDGRAIVATAATSERDAVHRPKNAHNKQKTNVRPSLVAKLRPPAVVT